MQARNTDGYLGWRVVKLLVFVLSLVGIVAVGVQQSLQVHLKAQNRTLYEVLVVNAGATSALAVAESRLGIDVADELVVWMPVPVLLNGCRLYYAIETRAVHGRAECGALSRRALRYYERQDGEIVFLSGPFLEQP